MSWRLFLLSFSISFYAFGADEITLKKISGDAIGTASAGTLGDAISEAGSTQVVRVGVGVTIGGGEVVTISISVAGDEAEVLNEDGTDAGPSFLLNDSTAEKILIIKGVDDLTQDGSQDEIITFETSGSTVTGISNGQQFDLTVSNSDNDGASSGTAPSEPSLRYPLEGANFTTNESFLWEHAYDREDDSLNYQLCVRKDGVTTPQCISVAASSLVPGSGVATVSWPIAVIILLTLLFMRFGKKRRRTATHIVQFAPQSRKKFSKGLVMGILLFVTTACGNQALLDALQVSPRPSVTSTFPNLQDGQKYYWTVYVDDASGNVIASSDEYSFTAKDP